MDGGLIEFYFGSRAKRFKFCTFAAERASLGILWRRKSNETSDKTSGERKSRNGPPPLGSECFEAKNWRIIYRVDADAIVIAEVFRKKTRRTPPSIMDICRERLRRYDDA
jgi:hypothetical protein